MGSTIKEGLLRHLIVVSVKGKITRASILPMESAIRGEHPIVVLVKGKIVMTLFHKNLSSQTSNPLSRPPRVDV
jgi:hypothetical protein